MEKMILRSFVDYPQNIDEFLKTCPFSAFTDFGQLILRNILELRDKKALSIETLTQRIPLDTQGEENFLNFLSCEANPNYLHFAPSLLENARLERQFQIATRLAKAYENRALLDLDLLTKEYQIETKEAKNLNDWINYYKDKPNNVVYPTKIKFIDDYLNGGLELAQLVLISGDPEAGKTRLCLQILENLAQKHKVCFFCFEFTAESYVRNRNVGEGFNENFFIINDGYDISEVANNIRILYKQGVKFFLIDSQMRLTAPQGRNMEEEETSKFSTLAKLCHSLNIVIFLIIQTSKTDKDNPIGSKKGGHEASIIFRLERCKPERDDITQKANEYDANARIFFIRKNKQTGKHPKEKVFFDTEALKFKAIKESVNIIYEVPQEQITISKI